MMKKPMAGSKKTGPKMPGKGKRMGGGGSTAEATTMPGKTAPSMPGGKRKRRGR